MGIRYQIEEGIVLREILGNYLLIATGKARDVCPDLQQINREAAFYWSLLEEGMDSEQMLEAASAKFGMEKSRLLSGMNTFLGELESRHYISRCSGQRGCK